MSSPLPLFERSFRWIMFGNESRVMLLSFICYQGVFQLHLIYRNHSKRFQGTPGLEQLGLKYKVGFTNSQIVLIVDRSLYLKTKKLLSVFPLFMTDMLSFLRTRLPTISCLYVNHITSNA
jgi:hypothetical protein